MTKRFRHKDLEPKIYTQKSKKRDDIIMKYDQTWGHRIDLHGLKDLYAPQKVIPYTLPPAGIDNLALSSDDTIMLPGGSKVECHFEGFFRVARGKPTKKNWAAGEVYVNMIEINLRGSIPRIGDVSVSLNPDFVSAGQTFPAGAADVATSCRIATGALFDIPGMSILFNKEPILLMNDAIKAIPPVEDPNGEAHLYKLPLFSYEKPDEKPKAYLTKLKYTVGNYITKSQVEAFRKGEKF